MKKKIIKALILFSCSFSYLKAQPTTFIKTYGDGASQYGRSAAYISATEEYAVAGTSNNQPYVLKVSGEGNVVWQTVLPYDVAGSAFDVLVSDFDGNLLVNGRSLNGTNFGDISTPFLVKLDVSTGAVIWHREYTGGINQGIYLPGINQYAGGTQILMSGSAPSVYLNGDSKATYLMVDQDGLTITDQVVLDYGGGNNYVTGGEAILTTDGIVQASGMQAAGGGLYEPMLLRNGSSSDFTHRFDVSPVTGGDSFYGIQEVDNGFVCVGGFIVGGQYSAGIAKLNPAGLPVSFHSYPSVSGVETRFTDIQMMIGVLGDTTYIVPMDFGGTGDAGVAYLDRNFDIIWSASFGDPGANEQLFKVIEVEGGSAFLGVGYRGDDLLVVKFDKNGDMTLDPSGTCVKNSAVITHTVLSNPTYSAHTPTTSQPYGNTIVALTPSNPGFSAATPCVTFPLEWLSFEAEAIAEGNSLSWTTAKEVNTASFEIEVSEDNHSFQKVGQMNATTNSSSPREYTFFEPTERMLSYYRIKQVDLDGSYSYSKKVEVLRDKNKQISVYPTLLAETSEIYLKTNAYLKGEITCTIYSLSGQTCTKVNFFSEGTQETFSIEAPKQSGAYLLEVSNRKNNYHFPIWVK